MTEASETPLIDLIDPPTDNQLRMARAVLDPLTDTQRRAVYAVVLHEAALELKRES